MPTHPTKHKITTIPTFQQKNTYNLETILPKQVKIYTAIGGKVLPYSIFAADWLEYPGFVLDYNRFNLSLLQLNLLTMRAVRPFEASNKAQINLLKLFINYL